MALYKLGHEIGRSTINRLLIANGITRAPQRKREMSWATFLKAHWGAITATDFFSVEVLTARGLVRYFVLFVIDLKTRRIEIAGVVRQPDGERMSQMARNLTDGCGGFLSGARYLIHDRDPLFTEVFKTVLRSAGVEPVRLPPRSNGTVRAAGELARSGCDKSARSSQCRRDGGLGLQFFMGGRCASRS